MKSRTYKLPLVSCPICIHWRLLLIWTLLQQKHYVFMCYIPYFCICAYQWSTWTWILFLFCCRTWTNRNEECRPIHQKTVTSWHIRCDKETMLGGVEHEVNTDRTQFLSYMGCDDFPFKKSVSYNPLNDISFKKRGTLWNVRRHFNNNNNNDSKLCLNDYQGTETIANWVMNT